MKKYVKYAMLIATCMASTPDAKAEGEWTRWTNDWMVSAQYGGAMAFGDDSYNVFQEFNEANGTNFSVSVGKMFTPVVGARVRGRVLNMSSRVNLEIYNEQEYAQYFPNKGFYSYRGLALQAECLINVTNIFRANKVKPLNIYVLAGAGINKMYHYDDIVEKWREEAGFIPNGWYEVDTRDHVMGCGVLGGIIELRLSKHVAINLDATCTFTGDLMEGIKYEEPYDAYITFSGGLTVYF